MQDVQNNPGVAMITLNPTFGPVGTPVTVTGNGFDPRSTVIITFDAISTTPAPVTPGSNGTFIATFTVPPSSLSGDHIVMASQVVDSRSVRVRQTFTVTTLPLNPTSNPVHTSPAFIQGSGIIDVGDVRFGGEARYVALRVRDSNTYLGSGLPYVKEGSYSRAMISVDTSIMPGSSGLNWLEIYDHFPASISVRNPFASSSGDADEFQPVTGTLGVWVNSGVALPDEEHSIVVRGVTSRFTYSRKQCTINFEGFDAATISRFRQSSDPRSIAGSVTSRLDAWFTHMDDGLDEPGPQNNLWFAGCWDWFQADSGTASRPLLDKTGYDLSTGYKIENYKATADGAIGYANAGTWGADAGIPAGEYVLSVYARGTAEFVVDLRLGGGDRPSIRKSQRINAGNAYQRVSVPFTNPPGGVGVPDVTIQASQIPKDATVNVGFAAIHRGRRPSSWTFPVDNPASPTQYTTQETRQSTYYAADTPPTGFGPPNLWHFNAGDVCWNTSRSPGPSGWTWNGSTWSTLGAEIPAKVLTDTSKIDSYSSTFHIETVSIATFTLPDHKVGKRLLFKNIGLQPATLKPAPANGTIDGKVSYTLQQYDFVELEDDGTDYWIIRK